MEPQARHYAWSYRLAPLPPQCSGCKKWSFGRLLCLCSWLAALGPTLWAPSETFGSRFVDSDDKGDGLGYRTSIAYWQSLVHPQIYGCNGFSKRWIWKPCCILQIIALILFLISHHCNCCSCPHRFCSTDGIFNLCLGNLPNCWFATNSDP